MKRDNEKSQKYGIYIGGIVKKKPNSNEIMYVSPRAKSLKSLLKFFSPNLTITLMYIRRKTMRCASELYFFDAINIKKWKLIARCS